MRKKEETGHLLTSYGSIIFTGFGIADFPAADGLL